MISKKQRFLSQFSRFSLLGQMSSFEFLFLFLGWLFASQKKREMHSISRPEFALQTRAIRGFAIAPAASLASLSPVATFGAPTILATRETRN